MQNIKANGYEHIHFKTFNNFNHIKNFLFSHESKKTIKEITILSIILITVLILRITGVMK